MNSLMFINLLLNTRCDLDPAKNYQKNYSNHLNEGEHFDFIIVGGGTAGAVVANRLSESQRYRVLLLEAGGLPTVATEIPAKWPTILKTNLDWNYEALPGNFSLSYDKLNVPRGKMLGGCGSFNGLTYVRSPPSDYDKWYSLGNHDWDYKSVSKYFKKAERSDFNSETYGKEGPLFIDKENITHPLHKKLIQAFRENGVDFLDEEGGAGLFQVLKNVVNGTRCSTAKAYLANLKRSNLHIALDARVIKVLFKKNKAVGVKVMLADKNIVKLHVKKEVILSAGAVGTPQLLLVSGIGPAAHLQSLGIHVKANLQVGQNLYDHYLVRSIFVQLTPNEEQCVKCAAEDAIEYCFTRGGGFSQFGIHLLQWSLSTNNNTDPNIMIIFGYAAKGNAARTLELLRGNSLNNKTIESVEELNKKYDILSFNIGIAKPKSSGSITLKSNNPLEHPAIDMNYLSDRNNDDLKAFLDTIKRIKQLLNTPAMKKLNATIARVDIPNCSGFKFDSYDYYECLVRNLGSNGCHLTGTCKMGPSSDAEAVVDPRLRVHGIKYLRVVDASVMPVIPNRNTFAPTVMVAEKGADLIKEDWELY